jgi:butyryl-CoA dehydrogenase
VFARSFTTNLPDEVKAIQELCRKFAKEELKSTVSENDKNCKYPQKSIEKLGEMGFMSVGVSAEYGGSNYNTLALSVVVEELSRIDASTGIICSIHNCLYANLLDRIGTKRQKEKWLKGYTKGKLIGAFALSESGE